MATTPRIVDLILKKRNGGQFTRNEMEHFINAVVSGDIQGSQLGAMLMSMFLKGLNDSETTDLTRAMMSSGDVMSWPEEWKGKLIDKHSTGGVGDKVSLILAPALAACGMKVPMISGRGLGHTGGTLDKLESIPGYQVSQASDQIIDVLGKVGCCIVGQTANLVPADRIIYATRDVTGTVDHVSLIAASIISKKAAENIDSLILDVKTGRGAFLQEESEARKLAECMVQAGCGLGINTVALLTDMSDPLGCMIGNALEVFESIQCLRNEGPSDLQDLTIQLGGHLLHASGMVMSSDAGCDSVKKTLEDGSALSTFCAMCKAQGVASDTAEALCNNESDAWNILPQAKHTTELTSGRAGYVSGIDAMACAVVSSKLGAGRAKAGETINFGVGLELLVKPGAQIAEGAPWIRVHHDSDVLLDEYITQLQAALEVEDQCPPYKSRVIDVIRATQ